MLARCCVARLTRLVRLFQQRLRSGPAAAAGAGGGGLRLVVRLVTAADPERAAPLALCMGHELRWADGPAGAAEEGGGGAGAAGAQLFDVVDVGCAVADHAGLLPLLVCAAPRLARHRGARLRVPLAWWSGAATSLRRFVFEQ